MKIALLVITDGRDDLLAETIASLAGAVGLSAFAHRLLIDDTGDQDHADLLRDLYPRFGLYGGDRRRGFAGAIHAGWQWASVLACDYVFHLEDDFVLNPVTRQAPGPLPAMLHILETQPHVVQVVLKRQPWNDAEQAAGGIVELHPHDFTERTDGSAVWTEHRRFFSTNPCLYRASLCELGWPQVAQSEGVFTHQLLADLDLRFAFLGAPLDPPLVTHIGRDRVGTGY